MQVQQRGYEDQSRWERSIIFAFWLAGPLIQFAVSLSPDTFHVLIVVKFLREVLLWNAFYSSSDVSKSLVELEIVEYVGGMVEPENANLVMVKYTVIK